MYFKRNDEWIIGKFSKTSDAEVVLSTNCLLNNVTQKKEGIVQRSCQKEGSLTIKIYGSGTSC